MDGAAGSDYPFEQRRLPVWSFLAVGNLILALLLRNRVNIDTSPVYGTILIGVGFSSFIGGFSHSYDIGGVFCRRDDLFAIKFFVG